MSELLSDDVLLSSSEKDPVCESLVENDNGVEIVNEWYVTV